VWCVCVSTTVEVSTYRYIVEICRTYIPRDLDIYITCVILDLVCREVDDLDLYVLVVVVVYMYLRR